MKDHAWFVLLLLLVATIACTLGQTAIPNIRDVTVTNLVPTALGINTNSPTPILNPTVTVSDVGQSPPAISCTVRADWLSYTVAVGDSLPTLAVTTGTTVAELVQANCLTDANAILAGQRIYVPQQPVKVIPNLTLDVINSSIPSFTVGCCLAVGPVLPVQDGWVRLQVGKQVQLQWSRLVDDGTTIDFYYTPTGYRKPPQLIGSVPNRAGGQIAWQVPVGVEGYITAITRLGDTLTGGTSEALKVHTELLPSTMGTACIFIPYAPSLETPLYSQPNTSAAEVMRIDANERLPILNRSDYWYEVQFVADSVWVEVTSGSRAGC